MTSGEFRAAVHALHWSASYIAEQAGYHRTLGQQWANGRCAVPEHVAAWLRPLVEAHRRVGPPPQRAA